MRSGKAFRKLVQRARRYYARLGRHPRRFRRDRLEEVQRKEALNVNE